MAANTSFTGTADATLSFDRPVDYLNIGVDTGVTFSFSLDGVNYIPVVPGFYGVRVGGISTVYISSSGGSWGVNGVQA